MLKVTATEEYSTEDKKEQRLKFEEIFIRKTKSDKKVAKRLRRDNDTIMGAIHLQTILNFECLANSYFFLIRKLKTDVRKTVIMIKIFRTWDCMP